MLRTKPWLLAVSFGFLLALNGCGPKDEVGLCDNAADDDGDGDTDCDDADCAADPACEVVAEICDNLIDDDGDTDVDCDDADCVADPACQVVAEICNNAIDDDGDLFTDCEDDECANDAGCATVVANACAGAIVAQGVNNGDTLQGDSDVMTSACQGVGDIVIFSFTPAAATINLTLASATDQGLIVRGTCEDAASEIDCVDAEFGGTDEVLNAVPVTAGQAVFIIVQAFDEGEEGPFVLTIQ